MAEASNAYRRQAHRIPCDEEPFVASGIDEIQRPQNLETPPADEAVVRDFEAAEARGEVEWLTDEEMRLFLKELVEAAASRVTREGGVEPPASSQ